MSSLKKIVFFVVFITITTLLSIFCKTENRSNAELVKADFDKQLTEFQSIVDQKLSKAVQNRDEKAIKQSFLQARIKYKQLEYYIEYFFPSTSALLNGAPIDEIELGENLIENPTGFQVMEEIIYEEPTAENRKELLNEVKKMQLNLQRVSRFNEQYQITDAQLFDAIRLEIFRITSLGITGFDTPNALQSIPETASALQGIAYVLAKYENNASDKLIHSAISYLDKNPDFNHFDRLTFITEYLDPISRQINKLRLEKKISTAASGAALRDDATSMFQVNAFNVNKFVGNSTLFINDDKIALGKILFNDAVLSNGNNRSCASCHQQSLAFTDGLTKAAGISKGKLLLRNTPTLAYAGLQRGFFYDLKAGTLEDQALDVVHHKQEMNGSLEQAAARINSSKNYVALFQSAYKDKTAKADPWKIQHVLASYIRSLSPFSSRFDRYMQGDKKQLSKEEKEGFNLFMGKAKCGSCHFAPLFNGTQAPLFIKSEAEVLGVPATTDTLKPKIDTDLGRYALYAYPQYKHAFKTSTIRNITKTGPYMHNGVYKTLAQVMDFYNQGGGAGMGINIKNQTLSSDKLNLSKLEIKQVIAFLGTLEDVQ
ncbi:cytochrome C peroxidase [Pedobacter psychrodurus]|uniref:Cytochrome C peroxidase n=1 Tax=Pedobacter psychrodurus TaxID=2530456 RepID=A0A4R0Q405_9SPHI|nr:cytochrome c peroxidase [Pedobacter psychrodurus]TCD25515.1 cytochrome C peroxidase [Pedobacter psychrodurus]